MKLENIKILSCTTWKAKNVIGFRFHTAQFVAAVCTRKAMNNMDLINKLKKEHEEVGERLIRLNDFLSKGQTVSDTQRELLLAQASAMSAYVQILAIRIKDLEEHHG